MRIPSARWVAVAGTVCISFSAVFVALADVSPTTAAFWRGVYALPILVMLSRFVRDRDHRPARLRLGAAAAGAMLGIDLFFWHNSIDRLGAGLATVAAHTQVVFVGMLAWLLYRQLPTKRTVTFGAVIFGGVALVSGLGRADAFGVSPLSGTIFGIAAGLSYASFMVGFQASNPGGAAPAVASLLDATAGMLGASAIIGVIAGDLALSPTWPAHAWLAALAVLGQVVGWALLSFALPRLPALTVSMIILAQPMLAVVWGRLLLDESLSPIQAAGVALVLVGLVAVNAQRSLVVTRDPALEPA
jgi:drug/metabolite transporter (DMT)-like permease